jgi:hypothetical protein
VRGPVKDIRNGRVFVLFANNYVTNFHLDGKDCDWHATPSLKLIERPRKTKKVKVWVCVGPATKDGDHFVSNGYHTKALAADWDNGKHITQQIEVEVLDET